MARSYIGSVKGFADGFTQGFGLVNDAYTGKRKLDMAEEEMTYQREQDRLNREQDQRNFDAEQEAAERRYQAQMKKLQDQYELDSQQLAISQTDAEGKAALRKIQAETASAQGKLAEAERRVVEKEQQESEALSAIAQLDQIIMAAKRNGTQPDMAVVSELIGKTQGAGRFDITVALGADYQSSLAGLTNTLSTQLNNGEFDGSDPRILMGVDALINSQKGRMIGQTIDESFLNAPEQYRTGDYKIVSREAYNVDVSEGAMDGQGPPQLMVSSDVLVTAQDSDGNIVQYVAPMTDGRSGQTGEKVKIPATTMFDGIAGSAVLVDYLNTNFSDYIKAAKIEELGGQQKFQQAVAANTEAIVAMAEARPDSNTYLSNKKNGDLLPEDIARIAEDKTLGFGKKQSSFREDASLLRMTTREVLKKELGQKYVIEVDGKNVALRAEDFTDQELFEIAATFGGTPERPTISSETRDILSDLVKKRGGTVIEREGFFKRLTDAAGSANEARLQAATLGPVVGGI